MNALKKAYKILTKFEIWFMFILFFFVCVSVVVNILSRKLFSYSLNWVDELARYIMLICTCLGFSIAITERSHPKMDTVQMLLKGKARKVIVLVADVILAIIMIWFFILSIQQGIKTIKNAASTATLKVPFWVFFTFIPLGAFGASIRSLILIYEDLVSFKRQPETEEGALPEEEVQAE